MSLLSSPKFNSFILLIITVFDNSYYAVGLFSGLTYNIRPIIWDNSLENYVGNFGYTPVQTFLLNSYILLPLKGNLRLIIS